MEFIHLKWNFNMGQISVKILASTDKQFEEVREKIYKLPDSILRIIDMAEYGISGIIKVKLEEHLPTQIDLPAIKFIKNKTNGFIIHCVDDYVFELTHIPNIDIIEIKK